MITSDQLTYEDKDPNAEEWYSREHRRGAKQALIKAIKLHKKGRSIEKISVATNIKPEFLQTFLAQR